MRRHFDRLSIAGGVWCLVALCPFMGGCPAPFPTPTGEIEDGNRDPLLSGAIIGDGGEPNGSFDLPIEALFDAAGVARLQGTVSVAGDVDVFSLGALEAGDHIEVDVFVPGSALDASVVLFDGEQRLVYTNDDRGGSIVSGGLNPFVSFTIRHRGEPYYLAVSNSPFASSGRFTGSYQVDVTVTAGGMVPAPAGQTLLLEFRGAMLESSPLGPMTLAPFDAGAISSVYAGQTETLKEMIRDVMEQNFVRFNVSVITSDDPPPTNDAMVSTVYFGGFSATLFGIADSVDLYNADFCDDAIIFAESFSPNIFSRTPSVGQLAVAIGNIAAHEAGHLLGLHHVSDDLALMDDQSAADAFLDDQEFMRAPLSPDIMSLGFQDAALLLEETVGLRMVP